MKLVFKIIPVASAVMIVALLLAACTEAPATTPSPSKAAVKPAPSPSVFKVDSLAVNPSEINAGVPALITAKVTNTGDVDKSYQGGIRIDNTAATALPTFMGSDIVTIPAGKTQLLSVPLTIREPGSYKIDWDGVDQTLKVNPEEISSTNNPQNAGPATAPDFTAVDVVTGKTVSLSQYKGNPVLLNFVNYGCNPQTNQIVGAELLAIKQLQAQRKDFMPFSVFCGCCPPEVLRQFAKDNNLNWPWILDTDYSIARKYGNYLKRFGYPTLIFINKDQLITDSAGYLDPANLNSKLNIITGAGVKN